MTWAAVLLLCAGTLLGTPAPSSIGLQSAADHKLCGSD